LAALSTPGVANVILQSRSKGIGTFTIFVKSVTPSVSDQLIDNIDANIIAVVAEGSKAFVERPEETGMSMTISLRYINGIADNERDQIEDQVDLAITEYVNNLDLGDEFIVNELTERILSVSPSIKDLGEPNRPIDEVFLHRPTRLQDNKIREELLGNYVSKITERVIIEPSLATPITILRQN